MSRRPAEAPQTRGVSEISSGTLLSALVSQSSCLQATRRRRKKAWPLMNVLGLSFDYHDAAAAILVNGAIVAAAQEERFSRRKHDKALPEQAIDYCLKQAGLRAVDLDKVVYYEQPLLKFDRILRSSLRRGKAGFAYLKDTAAAWLREDKFEPRLRIAECLNLPLERVVCVRHHESHAASAFYCSPFDEATVITLDGVGEYETATIGVGRGSELRTLSTIRMPHSLGLFYSAFTAYLGFEVNEGEYKVMGMAGFGQPDRHDELLRLFSLQDDGTFRLDQRFFEFTAPNDLPYTPALPAWLGPARPPESPFATTEGEGLDAAALADCRRYANLAASVQKCTETVILHMVSRAVERTGIRNVCMAGGVALNSLANGRIIRELGLPLYVQPAAGDAGGAVGAALSYYHSASGGKGRRPLTSAFLGPAYTPDEIAAAIRDSGFEQVECFDDDDALIDRTAQLLADGLVLGWFQGRSEWGPRALGCRSILADPTRPDMQRAVNERIKFREPFRPFAPATPVDEAVRFFDMPPVGGAAAPEYFMLAVHPVREEQRTAIPAVSHADGTARVQVVSAQSNPLFFALLQAFGQRTGVPVLLNTSFNLRGEPVVETPTDALKTFAFSGIDALVMGRSIVHKSFTL
ncbi:hypothetical protein HUE56_00860 (plasmid) [Azospirillum oryzae]|uniref:Carbamoyltransferase n=1 Tax=Azospirillum oryzae TaxID=286727 RepID=A0A6N1ALC7_9PROT|nr:hypothetical protein HUE56_00860 [Azospirillum oryzae]